MSGMLKVHPQSRQIVELQHRDVRKRVGVWLLVPGAVLHSRSNRCAYDGRDLANGALEGPQKDVALRVREIGAQSKQHDMNEHA
jgi:hypothetical protein